MCSSNMLTRFGEIVFFVRNIFSSIVYLEQQSRTPEYHKCRGAGASQILNEPHDVSRVEHKQDRPKDKTLGNSAA